MANSRILVDETHDRQYPEVTGVTRALFDLIFVDYCQPGADGPGLSR
jgi:hypothetical protein